MKLEAAPLLQPEQSAARSPFALEWRVALPLVIAAIVAILAIYWPTVNSIVAIWSRSETFAHGFLIAPITIALIWAKRREVASVIPSVDYLGFVLLAGAGLVWLASRAGQVQVLQQYAVVTMIPAAVIAITGRRVALALAFPLAFLLLGVPIGEALIAPMMDRTADFTVVALQFSGIPVYREGNFFTIPSGSWSVVEGCSGLRYLIASVTVGTLFAYLTYRLLWKRTLFIALSAIVPVFANWLRAYIIVMIGHLSDMKLAHGVDHLIYGWVFFGLVMFLLLWLGSLWRDPPAPRAVFDPNSAPRPATTVSSARWVGTAAALVGLAAVWPLYAAHLDGDVANGGPFQAEVPVPVRGWTIDSNPLTDWRPRYEGASASTFQTYRKGDRTVVLYLGYYPQQRPGAELVTSTNIMIVQKHPVWSNIGEAGRTEDVGAGPIPVRQTRLHSARQHLLVWDWYRISGRDLTNPYVAKLLLARDKLLDRGDAAATIIVAAPYDEQPEAAAQTLREFMRDMSVSIGTALDETRAHGPASRR